MTKSEFAAYVEHVFRHHNNVVNNLLFAPSDPDISVNGPLLGAEARMTRACLPLNELVANNSGGGSPSFWARMHLTEDVPECEAATRQVESLIPEDQ